MANTHKHTPWRKAVLIPFWTLQLLLELLLIGTLALAVGVLETYGDDYYDNNSLETATHVVVPIYIAFIAICLILTITEIILLARHKLKPLVFVIMNVTKTTIFTVMFILDIISAVTQGGRTTSVLGVIIDIVLLVCFWGPLIYGSIIYHRSRKEAKSYKPVDHPLQNPISMEYPTQYRGYAQQQGDVEANQLPPSRLSYNSQPDPRFDTYSQSYSGAGTVGTVSPEIPHVHVQHHGGEVYEMESSRRALN